MEADTIEATAIMEARLLGEQVVELRERVAKLEGYISRIQQIVADPARRSTAGHLIPTGEILRLCDAALERKS